MCPLVHWTKDAWQSVAYHSRPHAIYRIVLFWGTMICVVLDVGQGGLRWGYAHKKRKNLMRRIVRHHLLSTEKANFRNLSDWVDRGRRPLLQAYKQFLSCLQPDPIEVISTESYEKELGPSLEVWRLNFPAPHPPRLHLRVIGIWGT